MNKVSKNQRLVNKADVNSFEGLQARLAAVYRSIKTPEEEKRFGDELKAITTRLYVQRIEAGFLRSSSVGKGNFPGAQAGISCAPQVVNHIDFTFIEHKVSPGLDTLKFSLWLDVPPAVFSMLETIKKAIQDTPHKESMPVIVFDSEWNLSRTGTPIFSFVLKRGDISLLLSKKPSDGNFPNGRLEIGSMSCWEPGYEIVYRYIFQFLERTCFIHRCCVSEVHLCLDVVGLGLDAFNLSTEFWRRRAKKLSHHWNGGVPTGATFGSGPLSLRIYDKIIELKEKSTHKQALFKDVWGLENFDDLPVTRIEFHMKREAMREFYTATGEEVETFDDLCESLGSLWRYLTQEWAVMTDTMVDRKHKNQSHAAVHLLWQQIQEVDFGGQRHLSRQRFFHNVDVGRLESSAMGYLLSIAAAYGCQTVEEAQEFLSGHIPEVMASIEERAPGKIAEKLKRKENKAVPFGSISAGGVLL